jgi:hypothetical protein
VVAPQVSPRARHGLSLLSATLAVAYLVAMLMSGALPRNRQLIEFEARGVLVQAPQQISSVLLQDQHGPRRFTRRGDEWVRDADRQALATRDAATLSQAVKFMHTSAPVRVFQAQDIARSSMSEFGLETPRFSVTLSDANGVVLEADFGSMNTDGFLQYMRVRGRDELFLISRFVGAEWSAVAATQPP